MQVLIGIPGSPYLCIVSLIVVKRLTDPPGYTNLIKGEFAGTVTV